MKWLRNLSPITAATVRELMRERANAVQEWDAGKITAQVAQGIVARCNHEIARIAEGAA